VRPGPVAGAYLCLGGEALLPPTAPGMWMNSAHAVKTFNPRWPSASDLWGFRAANIYPRYTIYPQAEFAWRDSQPHESFNSWMGADDRQRTKTSRHEATTDKAEDRKIGCRERSGEGEDRKKREAAALGPMPNPLSNNRPVEPEPSGKGTANRDLIGTAVPIGDRNPELRKGTAMFRTGNRKRVKVGRKPDRSSTGTDRGREASAGTGLGTR
jgi:hypothetical protein